MVEKMRLDVEGSRFQWLDLKSEKKGLKEIKDDAYTLIMAMSINYTSMINVYARVSMVDAINNSCVMVIAGRNDGLIEWNREMLIWGKNVEEQAVEGDGNLNGTLPRKQSKEKEEDQDNELGDLEYNYHSEKEEVAMDSGLVPGLEIGAQKGSREVSGHGKVEGEGKYMTMVHFKSYTHAL